MTVKLLAASLVMAVVATEVERWLAAAAPGSHVIMQTTRVATAIGAGLATLAGAAKLLRIAEFDDALAIVRARARRLLAR